MHAKELFALDDLKMNDNGFTLQSRKYWIHTQWYGWEGWNAINRVEADGNYSRSQNHTYAPAGGHLQAAAKMYDYDSKETS